VVERPDFWSANWAWGLPIIVFTVLVHGFAIVLIRDRLVLRRTRRSELMFAVVLAGVMLVLTLLHGAEAVVWAGAYLVLGALDDGRAAMLYSLNALTAYGHDDLYLEPHWRLMGALEALNGVILFGLTTAFLFSVLLGDRETRNMREDDADRSDG